MRIRMEKERNGANELKTEIKIYFLLANFKLI